MMFTTSASYENPSKIIWWSIFNSCIGLTLVPMKVMGGTTVLQAAMITGCILGSLSIVAAASPGNAFLSLGPIIGCGFGILIASSFGQLFFPNSSLLKNITLYGGLGLFVYMFVLTRKRCFIMPKLIKNMIL